VLKKEQKEAGTRSSTAGEIELEWGDPSRGARKRKKVGENEIGKKILLERPDEEEKGH